MLYARGMGCGIICACCVLYMRVGFGDANHIRPPPTYIFHYQEAKGVSGLAKNDELYSHHPLLARQAVPRKTLGPGGQGVCVTRRMLPVWPSSFRCSCRSIYFLSRLVANTRNNFMTHVMVAVYLGFYTLFS